MEKQTKKVALITGANKGLGLEIARQLGQQGVVVVLGARQGKADAPAAELRGQAVDAHTVALDVTNAADIAALPAFFEEKFGRLDILVNNAGVQLDEGFDVSADTLRQTYEANVVGPYAITQALLPLLRQAPAGRIVNQSSIFRFAHGHQRGAGWQLGHAGLHLVEGGAEHADGGDGPAPGRYQYQGECCPSGLGEN